MTLFPFFIDIHNKKGLIIGGNKHAYEKMLKLKPYGVQLCIINTTFINEIEKDKDVIKKYKKFDENDLDESIAFVIASSDDVNENHWISECCKKHRILVNVVDDQAYCDFIFPSLIAHGNLSVGICTNGASPATSVLLKRRFEENIPENIEEILDYLQSIRPMISKRIFEKKKRFAFYYQISELCMNYNRKLNEDELNDLLETF